MSVARQLASCGFMTISIRQREPIGRGLKRAFNAASKIAWTAAATHFHRYFRERRFTESHARAAGYTKRKGEDLPRDSKAWRRSYTGIKQRSKGHSRPLEFSGDTRQKLFTQYRVSATSKGGRVGYRGASKFSFRNAKSQIKMNEEFRRLLPEEGEELGNIYDRELDEQMAIETAT